MLVYLLVVLFPKALYHYILLRKEREKKSFYIPIWAILNCSWWLLEVAQLYITYLTKQKNVVSLFVLLKQVLCSCFIFVCLFVFLFFFFRLRLSFVIHLRTHNPSLDQNFGLLMDFGTRADSKFQSCVFVTCFKFFWIGNIQDFILSV